MSLGNKEFDLEVYTKDKTMKIDVTLNEERISAGKTFLGTVTLDFNDEKYYVISPEELDNEHRRIFIDFVNRAIVKDIVLVEADEEIGRIQKDSENKTRDYFKFNNIPVVTENEKILMQEYEQELSDYHLGYKPEYEMLY